MAKQKVTRRQFLELATATAAGVTLAPTTLLVLPTQAAAAQASSSGKLGQALIGKLEGPELILDPTKWPRTFNEAPMLAELVKAGKLPPVERRLPAEPMVIKPVHGIGRYGGTWRRGFTGPGEGENGNSLVSTDKILFWDYTGTKVTPCLARAYQVSEEGCLIAIFLRQGHRWSDGEPFTADDFFLKAEASNREDEAAAHEYRAAALFSVTLFVLRLVPRSSLTL